MTAPESSGARTIAYHDDSSLILARTLRTVSTTTCGSMSARSVPLTRRRCS